MTGVQTCALPILLIIPAVAARFWTERTEHVVLGAGLFGGLSGYVGAALSASAPALPTGPVIVLVCAFLFVLSLLFAPIRGVLASLLRHRRFQVRVHRRQGLLALAHSEAVHDRMTLAVLRRDDLIRADGVATDIGRAQAAKALLDERRWEIVRQMQFAEGLKANFDGLTPIEGVLTKDELAEVDRRLGPLSIVGG